MQVREWEERGSGLFELFVYKDRCDEEGTKV